LERLNGYEGYIYCFRAFRFAFPPPCVDRLSYDISKGLNFEITIDGSISDQPGPYEVRIYNVFDIESKETRRMPVSVRNVIISDDKGNAETLNAIEEGIYQTSPTGIQGVPGGVYKMKR